MSDTPNKRELGQIMQDLNRACADATINLHDIMQQPGTAQSLPHTYIIPEISVEIAVSLSSENGGLKALLSGKDAQQATSRLTFKYVATPRGG